jgi:flagellar motor protein MotB
MDSQRFGQPDTTQADLMLSGVGIVHRIMRPAMLAVLMSLVFGCTSLTGQRAETPAQTRERELLAQIQEITVRAESIDQTNINFQKNLGQRDKDLEKAEQELIASQNQLAELTNKVAALELELAQSRQSVQTYQASMHRQSTVTVMPNSSFHRQQLAISSPGVTTMADGDYIRVRIPDHYLFQTGGVWELSADGRMTLTEVGNQLRLNFPNQEIGVEGHTNQLHINSHRKLNAHEVSTKKAFTVANYLISDNILEEGRLRIGGAGANRPIDFSGTTDGEKKNSRIELVVYPTTWK